MSALNACLDWREKWAVVCVPGDVMGQDEMGLSPLHSAAISGNSGAMRVLLEARCDPLLQNWRGWTALHIAAHRGGGGAECVEVVLSFLASRDLAEAASKSVDAAQVKDLGSARQLARVVDGSGRSALHVWSYSRAKRKHSDRRDVRSSAGQEGASRAFKMLVQASCSTFSNEVDGGRTQLHVCGAGGSARQWTCMVEMLEGVDICAREKGCEGRSAVAIAATAGNSGVVEAYVQGRMGPLSLTDARGRTILDLVCFHSLALDSHSLRDLWDSLRILDRWPVRPSIEFVDLLNSLGGHGRRGIGCDQGAGAELKQILADESLLSAACRAGDTAIVKRLLDLGISPDASSRLSRELPAGSAGARAARTDHLRDGKFPIVGHQTPVVIACQSGNEKMLRLLVQHGRAVTDVLTPCKELHESVRRRMAEGAPTRATWCQRALWACGRETPLVTCVRHGFFECAQVLVDSGCACDAGWARDPFAAAAGQHDLPASSLSALAVLLLLAPARDPSKASLTR